MNEPATEPTAPSTDPGFLQLESIASMQRLGDRKDDLLKGGSTLIDLDGLSEELARRAAGEHRSELAHGHHVSERYRVLAEIARGGMGAVLEVHDSDLDRAVAMKVLLRDTRVADAETGAVNRFIAEAQLTGSLEHPNIVPVHELGLDSQGRVYFTMKRVKGRSLRHIMDKLRQGHAATLAEFSQGRLLSILLKVCDAIEFAHSRGIVHRDLKPENIMVGQFGEVLVMDWGLAKQVRQQEDAATYQLPVSLAAEDDGRGTREGTISGTPAYMAPEQARGAIHEITARTDIFCLGGMLYEMLCLVPPFLASRMSDALDNSREHRLLMPREKLEATLRDDQLQRAFGPAGVARGRKHPRELVSVAMRAMHERRELRYHSAGDFKRDIENFLSALPVSAHRQTPWGALSKWSRRNPTRAAVFMLALVFALTGGVIAAAWQAQIAADRQKLAEAGAEAERETRREAERRLSAEQNARDQAERARVEAERVAQLEAEKTERERRDAEALAARHAAFTPYSQAADLRGRSATFADWGLRADVWRKAADLYRRALQLDPQFVEAHLELAGVYADLGYDDDALTHFARADALTATQTGRGHVEALMAFAMYDFQRKVLREGLSANLDEVFRRFLPVRDAAEPGSNFARIAEVLLDLGQVWRIGTNQEFARASRDAAVRLAELERTGLPLWEVYTLLALVDEGTSQRASEGDRSYLERARELKPNLPLLVWLEARELARRGQSADPGGLTLWDRYIERFSYDPRGYYSRANLRFHSDVERDPAAERKDLEIALALNPRYADAHKLMLRIFARAGHSTLAIRHIEGMRLSQSGMDHDAIDLIEVELTAATGEYPRLTTLILAALSENATHGVRALAQAASVLLRDHEYTALLELCGAVASQGVQGPPPVLRLFQGRALTMLGQFDDAQGVLRPLEENPLQISPEYRPLLRDWSEDARRYPLLLEGGDLPAARYRFDIGRILAMLGSEPVRYLDLLDAAGVNGPDLQEHATPADEILRAAGFARLSRRASQGQRTEAYDNAVFSLKRAFDEGYLNRAHVYADEDLAPLTSDQRLIGYFDVR